MRPELHGQFRIVDTAAQHQLVFGECPDLVGIDIVFRCRRTNQQFPVVFQVEGAGNGGLIAHTALVFIIAAEIPS